MDFFNLKPFGVVFSDATTPKTSQNGHHGHLRRAPRRTPFLVELGPSNRRKAQQH
jgi:hypothetical protein